MNKNCHDVPPDAPYELIVVQCDICGFCLGLDATFLRGHPVTTMCPNCGLDLEVEEIE